MLFEEFYQAYSPFSKVIDGKSCFGKVEGLKYAPYELQALSLQNVYSPFCTDYYFVYILLKVFTAYAPVDSRREKEMERKQRISSKEISKKSV